MIAASIQEYHCHMLQTRSKETVQTLFMDVLYERGVRTRIFWHLHHCPANSRTKLIFQDFPGPGNFTNTVPGHSQRRGNPVWLTAWPATAIIHYTIQYTVQYKARTAWRSVTDRSCCCLTTLFDFVSCDSTSLKRNIICLFISCTKHTVADIHIYIYRLLDEWLYWHWSDHKCSHDLYAMTKLCS